jgi:autotransporter passenger strand-loop-strand repeat protein
VRQNGVLGTVTPKWREIATVLSGGMLELVANATQADTVLNSGGILEIGSGQMLTGQIDDFNFDRTSDILAFIKRAAC